MTEKNVEPYSTMPLKVAIVAVLLFLALAWLLK